MYVENITSNGVTLNSAGKSMQIEVYEKIIKRLEEENKKLKENRDNVLEYLKKEYNLLIEKGYMERYTHGKLEEDIDFLCNELIKEHIDIREMLEGEE